VRKPVKQRIATRLRKIAIDEGITYHEVNKIWQSQFKFAKEKLESYSPEHLANASKDELEEIVFNFLYLGKIFTTPGIQWKVNKKRENNETSTSREESNEGEESKGSEENKSANKACPCHSNQENDEEE
jgi:hypothetical protein